MSPRRNLLVLPSALLGAALVACGTQAPTDAAGDPQGCISCHVSEFQSAKHHQGKQPSNCAECHALTAWKPTLPKRAPSSASSTKGTTPGEPVPSAAHPAAEPSSEPSATGKTTEPKGKGRPKP